MNQLIIIDDGGGTSAAGFLDGLAVTPSSCLSLRKLISTAGFCMRIRRSSDNTEQDIGFSGSTVGSGPDTSAITAFVGSSSAFVVKLYDQTGRGFDAVQATASNQPRIVNAGTYDGKLVFDASNDSLKIALLDLGNSAAVAAYAKLAQPATGTKILWETTGNYNTSAKTFVLYTDVGAFSAGMSNTGSSDARRNDYTTSLTTMTQISVLYDRSLTGTSEIAFYKAGTLQTPSAGSTSDQTTTFNTNYDTYIGSRAGTSLFADLNLDTLVFYKADTSSIRTSIEAIVA